MDHPPEAEKIIDSSALLRSSFYLNELFTALAAAQGKMRDPGKTKEATVPTKAGPSYKYKYSDLADLLKIIRPVFAEHGLSLLQFPVNPRRGAVTLVSRLCHASGQWLEGELTVAVGDDRPQTLGGAITYARRYAAGGIAGISPDEDDDAGIAQDAQKTAEGSKPMDKPTSVHDAVYKAAVAPPPQKKSLNFDKSNPKDLSTLKALIRSQVDEHQYDAVAASLDGLPWPELQNVLKKFT